MARRLAQQRIRAYMIGLEWPFPHQFWKMAAVYSVTNVLSVSGLIFKKPKAVGIPKLTRYLSLRPKYYYFRFLKTNSRHIEILLPVSILTTSLSLRFCIGLANFMQIG